MTLRRRLADLRAAGSIADIVVGNVRMASQAAREAMCVDLGSGYRLIFEPNHSDNPVTLDGNVDWQAVSRIKVNGVDKSDA